jgi:hypothetical protein
VWQVKLTPSEEVKQQPREETERDPLTKPLLLDDGRWAVFCWYAFFTKLFPLQNMISLKVLY